MVFKANPRPRPGAHPSPTSPVSLHRAAAGFCPCCWRPRRPWPADPNMWPESASSIRPSWASPFTGPAGKSNYYVDQGPLNASVANQQATAMVDAAAALWSAVPTAGVTLTDNGTLNEDVSSANIASAAWTSRSHEQTNQLDHRRARRHNSLGHQLSARQSSSTPTARSSTPSSARARAPTQLREQRRLVWLDNVNPSHHRSRRSLCSTASAPPAPTCWR